MPSQRALAIGWEGEGAGAEPKGFQGQRAQARRCWACMLSECEVQVFLCRGQQCIRIRESRGCAERLHVGEAIYIMCVNVMVLCSLWVCLCMCVS